MSSKDKTALRAECAKRGITFLTKWTKSQLTDAIKYDKIEYKPVKECKLLVIGITKWESPVEVYIPDSRRNVTAFITIKPKGAVQSAGHTTVLDELYELGPKHFEKTIVCDASPLTKYNSSVICRTAFQQLKKISCSIIVEAGRTSTIANKNTTLRSFVDAKETENTQQVSFATKEATLRAYQLKLKKEEEVLNGVKEERYDMPFSKLNSKNVRARLKELDELMESCIFSKIEEELEDEDTPERFLEVVNTDTFCENFCESVKLFATDRFNHYNLQSTSVSIGLPECTEKKQKLMELMSTVTPDKVRDGIITAFTDRDRGLASLIGRKEIKAYVISQLRSFARNWRSFGKVFPNICLMGKAGSGKTTVGSVLAFVYGKSCIYCTEYFVAVTRSDLVGEFIGHTAPKTKEMCKKTLEGVLLIDEAYQLAQGKEGGRDFGQESLAEIVNFLDKHMACSVVIVAGYEREIKKKLFGANEGLNRRFPSKVVLKDYSAVELCYILIGKLSSMTVHELPDSTLDYIFTVLSMLNGKKSPLFEDGPFVYQGGDMLNLATILSRKLNSFVDEPTIKQQRDAIDSSIRSFLASKVVEL